MNHDYLDIAREYMNRARTQPNTDTTTHENAGDIDNSICVKSVKSVKSPNQDEGTWYTVRQKGVRYVDSHGRKVSNGAEKVKKGVKGVKAVDYEYTTRQVVDPSTHAEKPLREYLKIESVEADTRQILSAQVSEYMAEVQGIDEALGVIRSPPGEYDDKATIPGGTPPLQAVLAQQEWLSTIDWQYGLRCGRDGHQCKVCKGLPCPSSCNWR